MDFHLLSKPSVSPLWVPRWKPQEPSEFNPKTDTKKFGEPEVGKLLSGIAGHSLCLDLFGMPSPDEIKNGATLHGEAGVLTWQISAHSWLPTFPWAESPPTSAFQTVDAKLAGEYLK